MHRVELYSTEHCGLCEEAKASLKKLQANMPFEFREVQLTPEHPLYAKYLLSTPVVMIDGTVELAAPFDARRVADVLLGDQRPGIPFYVGKALEALGLISVACGLTIGLLGDLKTEGYLFVGGLGVFLAGWLIERRHRRGLSPSTGTRERPRASDHE
jgi:hypothetical protein